MSASDQGTGEVRRARDDHGHASVMAMAAYVAALDIATEIQLAAVLQRLVDLARDVIPSKYAALGVADADGHITEFITSGITPLERARIGPIPQGHGLLGALITERAPMIVPMIGDDPRSTGFPANHPPMHSLLGVPILLGNRVLGNLYLTERLGNRTYDENDLEVVQILAANAASAIDRAQLYGQVEISRREAEDQRDQLRVILDSLPSAVLIQQQVDGRIEVANASARELIGLHGSRMNPDANGFAFLRSDGFPLPREQWPGGRALSGEVVRDRQMMLSTATRGTLPVLVQAVPLRNRHGRVERAVVVLQDITRMREAEQLKDDFLSLVSHEFRTPLTAIHGGARLLAQRDDALDAETRQTILADIVSESSILDQMMTNMLTLTAIQAGRLDLETEPLLVHALIDRTVAAVQGNLRHHRFVVEPATDVPAAEGNPDLLMQVLRNLYENAAKYSPPESTVTTSVTFDDARVVIHVRDEGFGIAAEHLESVFERFRRPGADPAVRGMGLGLYLCRHLVTAQHGSISVTSPGPGKGTTFSISLPISPEWSTEPD